MGRKNGNNKSVDLDIGTLSGHLWEAASILRGPEANETEIVGLEHIDPENLHIHR